MFFLKAIRQVIALSLTTFLCISIVQAQFKVVDNFNRADGPVGLGWSTYGNGAQILMNQLETFGATCEGGGIARTLDVTFPLSFKFNFSTNDPVNGGWMIGFNGASPGFFCNDSVVHPSKLDTRGRV